MFISGRVAYRYKKICIYVFNRTKNNKKLCCKNRI